MRDEPAGTAGYAWDNRSPDYMDPLEGIEDMDLDEMIECRDRADGVAEDPDYPKATRLACQKMAAVLRTAIYRRLAEECRGE